MDLALGILVAVLCSYALLWVFIVWIGERIGRRWAAFERCRLDVMLRGRNRMALHQTHGPFIPMPEELKTRDEMVSWMTRELPQLTEKKLRSSR